MNNIKDLQDSIRTILMNNGRTELSLGEPDELEAPTYIIWYDNACQPYEDPVLKVYLEGANIIAELDARDFGNTVMVYDCDIDRRERWEGIRANMLEVLERDGRKRCQACGKPLKGKKHLYCTTCRDLMVPALTAEQIMEKANRNIRRLASLAAGKDKEYKKQLIGKYIVDLS